MDVMLVEDNILVRECLSEGLSEAGLRVVSASNAAEALVLLGEGRQPDVLVSDLRVGPGLDGLGLIAVAQRRWPSLRFVLISGAHLPEPGVAPGIRFLQKPFHAAALARVIEEVAERAVPPPPCFCEYLADTGISGSHSYS